LDKTGEKDLSFISIFYNVRYKLCPYFPAFQYCWENLSEKLVINIINFFIFADKILINMVQPERIGNA